uniref:glycosyltransferase n=1 Tax=Trichocoleus desertorum TaxID=1481672 RepID=UPI0025B5792B|nr:glycosyltransferase family 2 protein [Trichocoleus desertorum]
MILLAILLLALGGIGLFSARVQQSIASAPQLQPLPVSAIAMETLPRVSVLIPAYNEAENIQDCILAVLNSTHLSSEQLELWVVDDQSSDNTLAIAQTLQTNLNDPRLKVLEGQSRPPGEVWAGKNWACTQGVEQASGDFLLFIDADTRLQPQGLETALQTAIQENIDLLSCGPGLICGCLAEWIVQPLIFNQLIAAFNFAEVNDPTSTTAFAAGPFMLFQRTAYEQLGGHRAVASQIVEDVELARRTKQNGLKLQYVMGANIVKVRMYRSWSALWEGWTKNLYLGAHRSIKSMLYLALIVLVVYSLPWLGLAIALYRVFAAPLNGLDYLDYAAIGVALVTILLQYNLRRIGNQASGSSTRYWWLSGLGGLLVAAIAIGSIIKTETGWGWTWRGRVLQLPEESVS